MAGDLFSRNVSDLGGVFTSDRAKLTLVGQLGVLTQSLSISYAQTITRLYEVGGDKVYYVGGRTQGQMSIARVIGPAGTMHEFYRTYGDVCKAKGNTINLKLTETNCSPNAEKNVGPADYDMKNCVIQQVQIGVQAQEMIISESTSLIFSSLQLNK